MSKAFLFLHSFEDAQYAVRALGLPIELIPQVPIDNTQTICVNHSEELERAYLQLCRNNSSGEFTAIRR